jgi:hypothetical protein
MIFTKLIDEIISVSSAVRYVMIADDEGRLLDSRSVTKSFIKNDDQSRILATDMHILKQLLKLYDEIVGKNTFTYLARENVHVLIFYPLNWIILVSCDRDTNNHEVMEIVEKINLIIKKSII